MIPQVIVMLSNNMTSSIPALLELLFDVFKIPFRPMLFVREGSNILLECPIQFSKITTSLYGFSEYGLLISQLLSWSLSVKADGIIINSYYIALNSFHIFGSDKEP